MSTTKQQPSGGATLAQQGYSCYCPNCEALSKELVELQAQKPIAWRVKWPAIGGGYKWMMVDSPLMEKEGFVNEALYTSPPAQVAEPRKRTWVGLTDVEWMNIVNKDQAWFGQRPDEVAHEVAKLVEAKLKAKNFA